MIARISEVQRICLVDDSPSSLESYGYTVEDAELEPLPLAGELGTLEDAFARGFRGADAGLSDFELHTHSYASFNGAELVARWYKDGFPGILCTRYEKAQIERIRPLRRWIPVLLKPDDLNPDSLMQGLELSLKELHGDFMATRRPWRTQVHFLYKDPDTFDTFFAEVPGWSVNEILKIRLHDLPQPLRSQVRDEFRCHAYANIGTGESEELFLSDWE